MNILKEMKLIFYFKIFINIIFNHTYINYTYKITLICLILFILSFFESFFKYFYEF